MIEAMRIRGMLIGILACAIATAFSSPARALAVAPRPAYVWAFDATLVVAGSVEKVADGKGTLRVTKTLAGRAESESIVFAPVTHPECMSGRLDQSDPVPADVAVGDEVVLFLVKGRGETFEVLDNGYAKVRTGEAREASILDRTPLASVERLVSVMKNADLDARDRGMIAAATADEQFVRRAACSYVEDDLGIAAPLDRYRAKREQIEAAREAHRAAVRRLGPEIAALVRRENGGEPCGAAIRALADASCAPDGAFDAIVKFARAIAPIDRQQFGSACSVLAFYDKPEAAEVLLRLAEERPEILAVIGANRSAEVRTALLAEFRGTDDHRVLAATSGLAGILERGRDAEVEDALFARLKGPVGPSMETTIAWALRTSRPLDVVSVILDKLSSKSLSKEGEETGAGVLYDYLRADPPIPGVRDLLVKRLAVITDRLDAGKTEATRPLYLLQQLGTPEAMASLRHAAESHSDPEMRQAAKRRSEPLPK
jgi:hypothetical protein